MDVDAILDELIQLSHELGTEERQLAILGEGNLSADCGDGTFWVKASGSNMATIDRSGFTRVRYEVVMDLAALKDPSEEQIFQGLKDSLVGENMRQPSVETFYTLSVCKIRKQHLLRTPIQVQFCPSFAARWAPARSSVTSSPNRSRFVSQRRQLYPMSIQGLRWQKRFRILCKNINMNMV